VPVETAVDAIASRVEAFGGPVAAARLCATRGTVETVVDAIAARVEPILSAVAALVEPVLHAVAATVRALRGVRPSRHRARE
jgi:hypothetical protein